MSWCKRAARPLDGGIAIGSADSGSANQCIRGRGAKKTQAMEKRSAERRAGTRNDDLASAQILFRPRGTETRV
jgi:hypothetical protein